MSNQEYIAGGRTKNPQGILQVRKDKKGGRPIHLMEKVGTGNPLLNVAKKAISAMQVLSVRQTEKPKQEMVEVRQEPTLSAIQQPLTMAEVTARIEKQKVNVTGFDFNASLTVKTEDQE